jgi:uncharacterized protein YdeI (YjbR/CyaY-like superfamily)
MKGTEEQIFSFADRNVLKNWLEKNHEQEESIWIKFNKTDLHSLKHSYALEEALCYGWIDSQVKRIDETFYKIKFSKRRKNSKWSEKNKETVKMLINSGRMTIHGEREIERAKKVGNWKAKEINPEIFDDKILRENLKAFEGLLEKYEVMSPSAKKIFTIYYNDAKRIDTKNKRLSAIVEHIINNKRIF